MEGQEGGVDLVTVALLIEFRWTTVSLTAGWCAGYELRGRLQSRAKIRG
jgi:hypothetical protein